MKLTWGCALAAVFLISPVFGGGPTESGFYVQPVDGVDASALSGMKPSVTVLPPTSHESQASLLPLLEVRDRIFAQSGLTDAMNGMDDFDRDSIYLRLRTPNTKTIETLTTKFPKLKGHESDLKKAQDLIAAEEGHE